MELELGTRKFVASSLLLASLVLTFIPTASCVSDDWIEVASFNGTIWPEYTEPFAIDCFDWKIKWSYTPKLHDSINPYIFRMDVKNASGYVVEFIFASNQIAGTVNMNQTGEYYLYIDPMHAENYSITIQQNTKSFPQPEANWVEVTRFNGTAFTFGFSDPFQIYHEEWRILWETNNILPEIEHFDFYVLHEDDVMEDGSFYTNKSIGSIRTTANENGTLNIQGSTGLFYIWIGPSPAKWELIVEQNIDSIPEFPSWIILPLV